MISATTTSSGRRGPAATEPRERGVGRIVDLSGLVPRLDRGQVLSAHLAD